MGSGARLKEILRQRKMTIKQLAETTGISLNTLYSITKRDSTNIDSAILSRITAALNITEDEFYGVSSLPTINCPAFEGSSIIVPMDSQEQELEAFTSYLNDMGYKIVIELGAPGAYIDELKTHYWSLYDTRKKKKYYIMSSDLETLKNNVNSYLKFQISELIPTLTEVEWTTPKK